MQINFSSIFRIATGAFLIENIIHLWPSWSEYFTDGKMVNRTSVFPHLPSILDLWPKILPIELVFYIYLGCAFLFTIGYFNRLAVFIFWIFQAGLLTFNPYIIHEPQQLATLFLFSFLFVSPKNNEADDQFYLKVLMYFLSLYYLLAAAKKLPDPLWRNGQAVAYFLRNPTFSNWPNHFNWLEPNSILTRILTYSSLAIELSLAFLIFTRLWRPALVVGAIFHVTLQILLNVGNFGWIMLVWYTVVIQFKHHESHGFYPQSEFK